MSAPQRIQLKRTKGWRMPPNTVKVDRSTGYGNPFLAKDWPGGATEAVERFRNMVEGFTEERSVRENIEALRGKNLACWCKPGEPCHADVLLELANA